MWRPRKRLRPAVCANMRESTVANLSSFGGLSFSDNFAAPRQPKGSARSITARGFTPIRREHCSHYPRHAAANWDYALHVGTTKLGYVTTLGDVGADDRTRSTRDPSREGARHHRELRKFDGQRRSVKVTVVSLVPELGKVVVEGDDGLRLSISERTAGVCVGDLRLGQHLSVVLQGVLAPKVLSATFA